MAHSHPHAPHDHDSGNPHLHAHGHRHVPHAHPAQPVVWSLLRMEGLTRLGLALALSALLWGVVLWAMR